MQQINLYLPEFRPNRDPVRAIHILWAGGVLLLLLIVYTVYSAHQNTLLQIRLAHEQQDQQALMLQMQALSNKKPAQMGVELDLKIEQLQKNLQRRQQLLNIISHQNLGNDKGFSAQLNAMGQASLATLSIESFSLQNGGTYAELSGKTRSADQIPLYLQKLREDASFTSVGFGVLHVERDEKSNGLLLFSLAKADDKNKKESAH